MKMIVTKIAATGLALVALGACNQTPGSNPTAAASPTASATPAAMRVRGTAQAVTPTAVTVQTYAGQSTSVPLDAKTGYAWVVPSSLSTLKNGDFIGTATTGPANAMKAVEVVIFPESMRGSGEGHYDWDVPGAVASKGGTAGSDSAMTNGTVTNSAMTNGTVTQSAMTNGTVTNSAMTNGTVAKSAGQAGQTNLTISYKGGTAQVMVPTGTPIVRFEPTTMATLAKGQKLFVVLPDGSGKSAAKFVAIGKDGLTPPM